MASTQLSGVPFYAVWVQNLLLHFTPRNNIRVGDEKEEDVMHQVESFSFWALNHTGGSAQNFLAVEIV